MTLNVRCPHCSMPLVKNELRYARVGVTRRMLDCLEAVRLFSAAMGRAPSFGEIALMLGITSKSGVHRLISSLQERGWLKRTAKRANSIVLIEEETRHAA